MFHPELSAGFRSGPAQFEGLADTTLALFGSVLIIREVSSFSARFGGDGGGVILCPTGLTDGKPT